MNKKGLRFIFVTFLVIATCMFFVGCASNSASNDTEANDNANTGDVNEKIVMRVGTPTTNDPQTFEMEKFKEALEKNSNGRIEVQLFPSCQLGSNSQMLQGLQAGTVQGLLEPTAFLGGFCSVLNVIDLPYFFKDVWSATTLLNGPAGDDLRSYLEKRGITTASFYPYGDRVTLAKFPVNSISDFNGKKIRVMGAKVLQDQYASWGGAGVPMDVPELYTALQQGTIDGLESAPQFFEMGKYYEVAKNLFMQPKGAEVTIFMMNKKWLDDLPDGLSEVVIKSAQEIQSVVEQNSKDSQTAAIEKMKAAGLEVQEASPELEAQLKAATESVHQKFLEENPDAKPIYDNLKQAIGM